MIERRLKSFPLERLARVVILVYRDKVHPLQSAVAFYRLPLCIQAHAICGLQLGAYPDIADRHGRIRIHNTTISWRRPSNKT